MGRCRETSVTLVLSLLVASASFGQSVRTFVSAGGIDNAVCSRVSPCRTFTAAIAAVNAKGEVVALDSGGYGPFTITKSVSVMIPAGIHAAIAPSSGATHGITVSAASSDSVAIRGVYLNNQGVSGSGIEVQSAQALHIADCVVVGFSNGLNYFPSGSGNLVKLFVGETIFRDGGDGLQIGAVSGIVHVMLDRCRIESNNGVGVRAQDGTRLTAHEVLASGNVIGFLAAPGGPETTEINLDECVASSNGTGVETSTGGTVRLTSCSITQNDTGVLIGESSEVRSLQNNLIAGNDTNVNGTLTDITGQ